MGLSCFLCCSYNHVRWASRTCTIGCMSPPAFNQDDVFFGIPVTSSYNTWTVDRYCINANHQHAGSAWHHACYEHEYKLGPTAYGRLGYNRPSPPIHTKYMDQRGLQTELKGPTSQSTGNSHPVLSKLQHQLKIRIGRLFHWGS
jgi:hypothetical protein